ncbi:MAG: hypothetical protein ASARMPREDX12_004714 [Alectoria sarmentosa]|nr:MAG: hypothetical protein ASARMPREDX12_004714 [Alectoria sarmentosa]
MGSSNQSSHTDAQDTSQGQSKNQLEPAVVKGMEITSSLEDFQTDEQRRVLDTVARVRKCGLESILSLPQLVVCGDQSAGKSSVLEALTEIPFPRNDNLCTRFATEIILRRANANSLAIKLIPDPKRPSHEQANIKAFEKSITNFDELPNIMNAAMAVMEIGDNSQFGSRPRAFARDVLSIEIEGPSRPQLTLVDIPGLIQTDTKGVTKADVDLVGEITDQYIKQPRTICLAVVSGANDYANQKILTKVREVDSEGDRTLGIITKPDRLDSGSGTETAFIELAQNQDIQFRLGWHVLKNRKFDERDFSLMERNAAEETYFRTSNFKCLPADCVGIDALRVRLSKLLFEHVRQELPKLRSDLEEALATAEKQLGIMGTRRSSSSECKAYLTQLSLDYYEVCKAAVGGHYEGDYFSSNEGLFLLLSVATIRRLRAVIQHMNTSFSDNIRINGHKYQIEEPSESADDEVLPESAEDEMSPEPTDDDDASPRTTQMQGLGLIPNTSSPIGLDTRKAREWVRRVLIRTRGKELIGNFNPLLVGELFWEQCSKWPRLAVEYLDQVNDVCSRFLGILLHDKCPKDIVSRLQVSLVQDVLKARYNGALEELGRLVEDTKSYPINYNHYYTDTLYKRRQERNKASLASCIEDATTRKALPGYPSHHLSSVGVDVNKAVDAYSKGIDPNMENVSYEEALDCLFAIYKVSQKTFVANVTTQVVERHMIRGLEKIFSPVVVNGLTDSEVEAIASEPASAKRQRQFLEDRIAKLKDGQSIFRSVMGSATM